MDDGKIWLRFVGGRPVSHVTTAFLDWVGERLAAEGKQVWLLFWDNACWHISREVRGWIKGHNRKAKQQGGVRILVCQLPVKSPWLNPIEPRWIHAKRAIVEPEHQLTKSELIDRVCEYFECDEVLQIFSLLKIS